MGHIKNAVLKISDRSEKHSNAVIIYSVSGTILIFGTIIIYFLMKLPKEKKIWQVTKSCEDMTRINLGCTQNFPKNLIFHSYVCVSRGKKF